ncbi:MAG: hypothetical protein ACI8P9_005653 [Parasphingorhabdus sp.]|jgi:hypothetical protein
MTNRDLVLVGNCAYDTAEQTFKAMGGKLGEHLNYLPDGEIGERISWISHIAYRVYMGHPDIETLERPLGDNGVEAWKAGVNGTTWKFRVRDGVEQVRFGEPGWRLGYARDAINSYFVFKTLKKDGVIPSHVRFQISLPFVSSAVRLYFLDPADHPKIEPAIAELLRLEVKTIIDNLPADDIAIQWDCAIEDTVIEKALNAAGGEVTDEVEQIAISMFAPAAALNGEIPAEVPIGYHACYGTSGGWPRREPQDLAGAVLLLNAAVAQSGRATQWLHLPTVKSDSDVYFKPLANLRAEGARVYLGLIHALHDEHGMQQQIEWASKWLDDFGIAAPCGFGRGPGKMSKQSGLNSPNNFMDGLIDDHLQARQLLDRVRPHS